MLRNIKVPVMANEADGPGHSPWQRQKRQYPASLKNRDVGKGRKTRKKCMVRRQRQKKSALVESMGAAETARPVHTAEHQQRDPPSKIERVHQAPRRNR